MAPQRISERDWQKRFTLQARWTWELRNFVFQRLRHSRMQRILEVGCGPGALTAEIQRRTGTKVCGVDLSLPFLRLARIADPSAAWVAADGLALPFRTASFDLTYCHFFLLWVRNPSQALAEMARVTIPGGMVLALAEPDYGGRIDYPPRLAKPGRLQAESLAAQGADPRIGRRLGELFHQAGLTQVEVGLLGGHWSTPPASESWESEWEILAADLQDILPADELRELKQLDRAAWQRGERILFVPTFYAWGRVPR